MNNKDQPAGPVELTTLVPATSGALPKKIKISYSGVSKRELCAFMAMQSLLGSKTVMEGIIDGVDGLNNYDKVIPTLSKMAYKVADAMLEEK